MKKRIAVIGAGGFAREVAWLISEINQKTPQFDFLGFVVSDLSKVGERDSKKQILGDFSWLGAHLEEIDALAFGIGNPVAKEVLSAELLRRFPGLEWPNLIHPSVRLDWGSAKIGKGVVMCASTVATVNITLDDFAMVNLTCTIGHESTIGPYSVLNPSVNISGGVEIGPGVLIGTGAQVLQYIKIAKGAIVGAGAMVAKDVTPNQTVVGIPAKPRS